MSQLITRGSFFVFIPKFSISLLHYTYLYIIIIEQVDYYLNTSNNINKNNSNLHV